MEGGFVQVVLDVPAGLADPAMGLCMQAGAQGVELRDAETLVPEGAAAPEAGRAHVVAWLGEGADPEALAAEVTAKLTEHNDGAEVKVDFVPVDAEDWVAKVREQVEPVRVGRRLRVRATWHEPTDDAELVEIVLDPGLAFGTGQHATTFLCLEAVEETVDRFRRDGIAPAVLDVGAGSGILSIAAAKLGARSVLGIENDPAAVQVALENAATNGVADRCDFTTDTAGERGGVYDLVLANIQLGVLLDLAAEIAARVRPGGELFLAGLIEGQAEPAEKAYAALGLVPAGRRVRDGWVRVHLRAPEG